MSSQPGTPEVNTRDPLRIFIGYDTEEPECGPVLAYSLLKHAGIPLDIRLLALADLDFDRPRDPLQTTDFTYTRFLVPHLCAYQGIAVFMDGDMLCLADMGEIAVLDMTGLALRVVKHDHRPAETVKKAGAPQTTFPRKNWSSLMVMDCARLGLWTRAVVERESGAFLHRFEGIPDERIGEIPSGWNDLDRWRPETRLLHFTTGGPWLAAHRDHPDAGLWRRYRDEYEQVRSVARETDRLRGGTVG